MKQLALTGLCVLLLAGIVIAQEKVEQWDIFELTLKGPTDGNPFMGTAFSGRFSQGDSIFIQEGFYDGNGNYIIRFMPNKPGKWTYTTNSNKASLNSKQGSFECTPATANNHGPVRVKGNYHFQYEDGTPYNPFGTTIYEWPYQDAATKKQTLATLQASPFNKARFLAVPPYKDRYMQGPLKINVFPFEGTSRDNFDFSRINPEYFKNLDECVMQLRNMGVEADLILFRPYDKGKWGFDMAEQEVNKLFTRYMVARYSAYRNIWWSLANENSFMKSVTDEDWDELFQLVEQKDPYHHLRSIHNADRIYDYTKPWVTHVSYQYYNVVKSPIGTALLRDIYKKPIVNDEINYEGDIDSRWGQLTGEEMVFRFWNAIVGGGYATHGESYKSSPWISNGGGLTGSSPARIGFLRKIVEAGPKEGIDPIDQYYENNMAGKAGNFYLIYFGKEQPSSWDFVLPKRGLAAGIKFKTDIIDTWNMTITPLEDVFEVVPMPGNNYKYITKNKASIKLPAKPYMALRLYKVGEGGKVEDDGTHELQ